MGAAAGAGQPTSRWGCAREVCELLRIRLLLCLRGRVESSERLAPPAVAWSDGTWTGPTSLYLHAHRCLAALLSSKALRQS